MEKHIISKVDNYVINFKKDIHNKINELKLIDNPKINNLLEYIYEYPKIDFEKEDFIRRKRLKNTIPIVGRCIAKRANNEQCTRRKMKDCNFCGTHQKGIPHGTISLDEQDKIKQIQVFTQEINGIIYYIDNYNNVYKTEDILNNKQNPTIITKCFKNSNNQYIINI